MLACCLPWLCCDLLVCLGGFAWFAGLIVVVYWFGVGLDCVAVLVVFGLYCCEFVLLDCLL